MQPMMLFRKLLRIWSNRANLNPDVSFKSYLFTIAYHFLLKEMRRQLNNPLMEDYVEYLNRSSTETAEAESLMCYDQFVNALEKENNTYLLVNVSYSK